ncbi:MFS transporter [[Actinomadura] parvosata]|uniref:MFS transporter n=1 Tax=[Actinomadura] parvosata TaxID=1955412 RepID=UPI001E4E46B9|nr:MFS transporter [Nonomuraea sp. ATCC 55076]
MGETRTDPRRRALAVCLVSAFMTGLDVSIVNVALPSIREGLQATEDGLQWTLSGYALTFGLLLVPAGRLGDARSRRTIFLGAVALFTLSSAFCGFAWSMNVLIVARLVQGMAAGMLNPQVSGLIQQMFHGYERGRAFGALGATIGVSTAAGPLIGGALVTVFGADAGWRWVFLVNLPIGLLLLPLAWRLLPRPQLVHTRPESMDPVGVLLLGVGVAGLLLPFIQRHQWEGAAKWLLVPAALAVLAGFVTWERLYRREPLVNLELFRKRSYSLGSAIALFYFAGFTGIFFIFTLYLQSGHGYSALLAGLAITPFALGSASAAMLGGHLVSRMGRRLVAIGLTLVIAGLLATMGATALVPGAGAGHERAAAARRGPRQRPGHLAQPGHHDVGGAALRRRERRRGAADRAAPRLGHRDRGGRVDVLRVAGRGVADRLPARAGRGGVVGLHRPAGRPVRPRPHPPRPGPVPGQVTRRRDRTMTPRRAPDEAARRHYGARRMRPCDDTTAHAG